MKALDTTIRKMNFMHHLGDVWIGLEVVTLTHWFVPNNTISLLMIGFFLTGLLWLGKFQLKNQVTRIVSQSHHQSVIFFSAGLLLSILLMATLIVLYTSDRSW
ncbi:MAG: hypothetical protein KDC57_15945 [Saprospiraceae bacterium]|nr:hypothetical protein [Saprospiraceae bacterium]